MFSPPKLHRSIPASKTFYTHRFVGGQAACRLYTLRLPSRRFLSLSLRFCSGAASEPSQSDFTSTVESSSSLQLSQFNFTGRHIFWLNVIACTVLYINILFLAIQFPILNRILSRVFESELTELIVDLGFHVDL